MKTKAIIQARVASVRLPGKVLIKILDKTILEYVIERVKRAKQIDDVIVATTEKEEDIQIVHLANMLNAHAYRGSEEDVLDRFYRAATLFGAEHIVRVTADCPLIDPRIIDEVIGRYFDSGADYCSNVLEETFPDGEDVEVFSFDALRHAWGNANLMSEREHITPYIKKNPGIFKLANVKNNLDLSDKRWALDRKEDLEFIRTVIESLYPVNPNFGIDDILNFLEYNPDLENINKGIARNEGYLKSLREDKPI